VSCARNNYNYEVVWSKYKPYAFRVIIKRKSTTGAWTETYFHQNKITEGVLCDFVYRFYQGVPYLWSVIWFHGVGWNAISYTRTPVKKGRPAVGRFCESHWWSAVKVQVYYTELQPKQTVNTESMVRNSLIMVSRCKKSVRFYGHFFCRIVITQIRRKVYKTRAKFHLHP